MFSLFGSSKNTKAKDRGAKLKAKGDLGGALEALEAGPPP
jgi:hypothetical protein